MMELEKKKTKDVKKIVKKSQSDSLIDIQSAHETRNSGYEFTWSI